MIMVFCKREWSVLQRRTMQQLGGVMGATAAFTVLSRDWFGAERTATLATLVSIFSVLPVLGAIRIVGRYLAEEPDEFVRTLVTRALLWGMAVTMVGDAVAGALLQVYPGRLPLVLLNADLLFAGTGVAFRLLQRSYR